MNRSPTAGAPPAKTLTCRRVSVPPPPRRCPGRGSRRPPRSGVLGCQRGGVTAEIAIALPVVALVAMFMYGGIQLGGKQLRMQEGAAAAARQLSRGERINIGAIASPDTVRHYRRGAHVCVELSARGRGLLAGIPVRASSCTLDKGR